MVNAEVFYLTGFKDFMRSKSEFCGLKRRSNKYSKYSKVYRINEIKKLILKLVSNLTYRNILHVLKMAIPHLQVELFEIITQNTNSITRCINTSFKNMTISHLRANRRRIL